LLWVLQVLPGGIGQLVYDLRDRLLRVVADRRGIVVPSLVADKRQAREDGLPGEADLLTKLAAGSGNGHAPVAPQEPVSARSG
jgi:hypothetical protein